MSRRLLAAFLCSTLLWWVPGSPGLGPVAAEPAQPPLEPGDPATPIALTLASSAAVAPVVVRRGRAATVGRPAHAASPHSTVGPTVVGDVVLDAYHLAALVAPKSCNLDVSLLAAIGQVESGNLAGYRLDADHRPVSPVLGPVLDGSGGVAAIPDTDGGQWDNHTRWDRAVGPMQFIPSSWRLAGVDLDADGERHPQDIEDAAGAAMVYLCVGGTDLSTGEGLRRAIFAYNHSSSYVRLVLAWKAAFDAQGLELDLAEPPPLQLSAVQYKRVARAVDVSTARTVKARASHGPRGDEGGDVTADGRPSTEDPEGQTPRPSSGTRPTGQNKPSTAPAPGPGTSSGPAAGTAPASVPSQSGPAESRPADPTPAPGAPKEQADAPAAQDPPAKDPTPGPAGDPTPGPAGDPTPGPAGDPTPDPGPSAPAEPECPTAGGTPSAGPEATASPAAGEGTTAETPGADPSPSTDPCGATPAETPPPSDPSPAPATEAASTEPSP